MKRTIALFILLGLVGSASASPLITGKFDGVNTFDSVGYGWGAGFSFNQPVVDIAIAPGNNIHVVSESGLYYYSYDAATDTVRQGGSTNFTDATSVAFAGGYIFTTRANSGGLSVWSYTGSKYEFVDQLSGFNAHDVAPDITAPPADRSIHVAADDGLHSIGLTGWGTTNATLVAVTTLGGAYTGGSAVYVDADDHVVRYGKGDGVNSLTWDGATSNYTDIGYSTTGGRPVEDIIVTDDGLWICHESGVHIYDAATPATYLGHHGDGTNHSFAVDADGQLHAAKHDGIIEWNYTPGVGDNVSPDAFFNSGGSGPIYALAAIPATPPIQTPLVTGKSDGVNSFDGGTNFTWGSAWRDDPAVVDIAVSSNEIHVVTTNGLRYYSYDPATDTIGSGGTYSFPDASGVTIAPDGTIYSSRSTGTGSGGGINAWIYSGGTNYIAIGWTGTDGYGFDARDVAVDSNGIIHCVQHDGVSAWEFDGAHFTQIKYMGGAYANGSAIYVGTDDVVRYGKFDGVNSLTWDGTNYTDIGFSYTGGDAANPNPVQDIVITGDGMWAAHPNGVHLFDAGTAAYKGHHGDSTNYSFAVDVVGQVYAAKHNGIVEWNWSGTAVVAGDYYGWGNGIQAIAALDGENPPIPEIGLISIAKLAGTNAVAITWTSASAEYQYVLETKDDLVIGGDWTTNTTVFGNGGELTVTAEVDQVKSFYRVKGE